MSLFFKSGGQSFRASVSASVLPMNFQGWFPLGLTDVISFQSKGLSQVFTSTTVQKHKFFGTQSSLWSNSHTCTWLLEKTITLTIQTFVGKVMSLLFNTLSKFVSFPSKEQASFDIMAADNIHSDFGAQENKSVTSSTFPPLFVMKWWDQMP